MSSVSIKSKLWVLLVLKKYALNAFSIFLIYFKNIHACFMPSYMGGNTQDNRGLKRKEQNTNAIFSANKLTDVCKRFIVENCF